MSRLDVIRESAASDNRIKGMRLVAYIVIPILFSCSSDKRVDIYKEIRTLPVFDMLLVDSTTMFSTKSIPKGHPSLLVYFDPYCEHCQEETKMVIAKMDSLKNVRIYFVSDRPLFEIKQFYQHFKLQTYQNITVGRDTSYAFIRLFKPGTTPYTAIYDNDHQLIGLSKGQTNISDIIRRIDKGI